MDGDAELIRDRRAERATSAFIHAVLGICNPVTHEFNWVDDPELALELISFAQHLLRKAKAARVNPVRQAWATLPPTMPTMNS
jgi:hypothetical protein